MKSSRSKRRRIMLSHISSQWPDLPVTFESLNDDTLTTILEFVGNKSYRTFGGLNKHCKDVYLNTKGMTKETFLFGYGFLADIIDMANMRIEMALDDYDWKFLYPVGKGVVCYNRHDVLDWTLEERKTELLRGICKLAGGEGRIALLDEVRNNVEEWNDKIYIFDYVGAHAACGSRLDVLKWIETKGLPFYKKTCARKAARPRHGQLHILKWLREERRLTLDEIFYYHAIDGGNYLHVMKWLREQAVDWHSCTFVHAAHEGNLDILHWLHDKSCPWPEDDDYHINEQYLKPEVLEWLRVNGYSNRVYRD